MKNRINEYHISEVDLSELEDYILKHGTLRKIPKKEYLIRQGQRNGCIGFVTKGMFRYTRVDARGNEHIVGYSRECELVGEYTANLCGRESLADIRAVSDCEVYVVEYDAVVKLWNSSPECQRLGRILAEQLFAMTYRRLIDSYCSTPEERYSDLMRSYPDLKELVPLKELASFIGVTPETLSNIRRRLLEKS